MLPRVLAGLLAFAVAGLVSRAASAEDFQLLCRGGPSMRIEARNELIIGGQTGTIVRVVFRRAANPGDVVKPRSGECTWLDRTLNDQEPTDFTFTGQGLGISFDMSGAGRILSQGGQPVLLLGGESVSDRSGFSNVLTSILTGKLFTVMVAFDGRTLRVSKVGAN